MNNRIECEISSVAEVFTRGKIQHGNGYLGGFQRGIGGTEVFPNPQGISGIANKIDACLLLMDWFDGPSMSVEPAPQLQALGVFEATVITW